MANRENQQNTSMLSDHHKFRAASGATSTRQVCTTRYRVLMSVSRDITMNGIGAQPPSTHCRIMRTGATAREL